MIEKKEPEKKRRNTNGVWFNPQEWKELKTVSDKAGLYPRQYIMAKVREK